MTKQPKQRKDKPPEEKKKPKLNKETLRDLDASKGKAEGVKGGRGRFTPNHDCPEYSKSCA